jgi:uncharacterized protein YqeY
VDRLRPEPGGGVQARLRLALAEALRARDTIAVSALRSALGAIGNAEAVEPGAAAPAGAAGPHVAGAVSGLGAAEVPRRSLSAAQIEQIVQAEATEREDGARGYERAGQADRASRLRREAQLLLAVLTDDDRPGPLMGLGQVGRTRPRPAAAPSAVDVVRSGRRRHARGRGHGQRSAAPVVGAPGG